MAPNRRIRINFDSDTEENRSNIDQEELRQQEKPAESHKRPKVVEHRPSAEQKVTRLRATETIELPEWYGGALQTEKLYQQNQIYANPVAQQVAGGYEDGLNSWITKEKSRSILNLSKGKGKIFAVWSNKGGVGKTWFSVNLGVRLAMEYEKHQRQVAIVDFNPYNPDVRLHLDMEAIAVRRNITHLIDNLDPKAIEDVLAVPTDLKLSNLKVMLGRKKSEEYLDRLNMDFGINLLAALKNDFHFVVVDTNQNMDAPLTYACLKAADYIFLVVEPELAAVKNNDRDIMTFLNRIGKTRDQIIVVANKMQETPIREGDIKKETGYENIIKIPYYRQGVINSVYEAVPLSYLKGQRGNREEEEIKWAIVDAIELVNSDTLHRDKPQKKRGWLARLLGGR